MTVIPKATNEAPAVKRPDAGTSDRASWEARSMRQSTFTTFQSGGESPESDRYKDPDWLYARYWGDGWSMREVAEAEDISVRTVEVWMDKHGIGTRRDGRPTSGNTGPLKDKTWLTRRYWYDGLSTREIADLLDVTYGAVQDWMGRHGIETRHCGAFSYSPADRLDYGPGWNEEKRESIRERDGRECVDCGMAEDEHRETYGSTLHVHHRVPARTASNPAVYNAARNLVTVCASCHELREQDAE